MGCFGVCGSGICEDACGVCGGKHKRGEDFTFVTGGEICSCKRYKNKNKRDRFDCKGICGGNAKKDVCGKCGGNGINWEAGHCDCHGGKIDECKKCGGSGIPAGFLDCEGTKNNFDLPAGTVSGIVPVDVPKIVVPKPDLPTEPLTGVKKT